MDKRIYIVLLAAVLTAGYAQAQLKFGARAGLNLTNVYQEDENGNMKGLNWKSGFQIGAVADYALIEGVSIQPGILFSQQGMKTEGSLLGSKVKLKWDLNYIQIPINLVISGPSLTVQAGPYLGFGIGGKLKAEADGESASKKIKFGSGDDADFKSFDFGLGVGAGLKFGNMQAGLGINYGLFNLGTNVKVKNIGLNLTLTYLFGK